MGRIPDVVDHDQTVLALQPFRQDGGGVFGVFEGGPIAQGGPEDAVVEGLAVGAGIGEEHPEAARGCCAGPEAAAGRRGGVRAYLLHQQLVSARSGISVS